MENSSKRGGVTRVRTSEVCLREQRRKLANKHALASIFPSWSSVVAQQSLTRLCLFSFIYQRQLTTLRCSIDPEQQHEPATIYRSSPVFIDIRNILFYIFILFYILYYIFIYFILYFIFFCSV